MSLSVAEKAERLARKRSIVAFVLGSILIVTQGQRMETGGAGPIAWALTGVTIAIFLLWASGVFRETALRGFLNDESSDLNRKRSLTIAFWNMIVTALFCYALSFVKPFGARDAIQIILTVGMSSALISFAGLERAFMRS
jgi:hypothetical protein